MQALAEATGAPDVRFDLAVATSSTRRRGGSASTDIVAEEDRAGRPLRTRHAVVHPGGRMPLTGLGVALVLERLARVDGRPTPASGLYFPSRLLYADVSLAHLGQAVGRVVDLGVP